MNAVRNVNSQELLSSNGAEHSVPTMGKVEDTGRGGNRMRTTLSDCDRRLVSDLSSTSATEQAAYSLAPTCMSSGDVFPHTDNNMPMLSDDSESSCISPAPITVTLESACSSVLDVDLNTPDAEQRNVLCESSNCCDETVTEVRGSPTIIRHLTLANKGKLPDTTASQIKGSNSAPSNTEKPGGDTTCNMKISTFSVCVS